MGDNKIFQIMALVIIVIGVVFACLYMCNEEKERDYPQMAAEGVIRVVTDYDPVGYYVENDSLIKGFNHDLIDLLQKYTPLKIEVVLESSLDNSINGLMQQKYDIIVRNIPTTSRLKDSLNFTLPVAQNKLVLVQRKKEFNNDIDPIRSHLDLAGKSIYVPENSPMILRIENLSREIGDTIHYVEDPFYGPEQLAMKVALGEIDFSISDEKHARVISNTLPEIDCSLLLGFTHLEAWAVRSNAPVLLDSLNIWIAKMKASPEYNNIYKQYYKE